MLWKMFPEKTEEEQRHTCSVGPLVSWLFGIQHASTSLVICMLCGLYSLKNGIDRSYQTEQDAAQPAQYKVLQMSTEVIRCLCAKWKYLLHLELRSFLETESGQQHCTHQSSVLIASL